MLVEKVRDLGLDGPDEQGTGPVAQDCMFEPKARVFHSVFVVSIVRSVGLVHREGDQPLSRCRVDRRRIWMNCSPARWCDPPSRHRPAKWRLTRVWKPLAAAERSRVFRRMMASVPVNTGGLIRQEQRRGSLGSEVLARMVIPTPARTSSATAL